MSITDALIREFDQLLATKPYFSSSQLFRLGLFGSITAASSAIKRGDLPSIKISSKRTVVPRSAVLEYFKTNLKESRPPNSRYNNKEKN